MLFAESVVRLKKEFIGSCVQSSDADVTRSLCGWICANPVNLSAIHAFEMLCGETG